MGKIKKFFELWPDIWAVGLMLFLWKLLPWILLWLDPTSAVIDDGIWQLPVIAVTMVMIFNSAAFAAIKFNFPELWKYYIDGLPQPQLWHLVVVYAVLMLTMAAVVNAIV
jgi:hypothetical protein